MNAPTPSPSWDDVQLMAWADGLLPPEQAAALEAAIEHDAALAQRAALMLPSRALVREAHDARLAAEPVPAALHDAVQAMVVRDRAERAERTQAAGARPRSAPATGWREALARLFSGFALPGAVAASVVFGGLGYVIGQSTTPVPATGTLLAAGTSAPTALAALLDRLPSGAEARLDGGALGLVASFRDTQGRLCRDFSLTQADAARLEGVACRTPDGAWRVDYAALAPPHNAAYTPAGPGSALDAYLAAIGAGQPLDEQAERALLQRE